MREEEKKEFKLPGGKVTVRLVKRQRGAVSDPNHVMYNLAPGASINFAPKNKRGSSIIDCPLNQEEIEFFEDKRRSGMSFDIGDLSPHAPVKQNYWRSERAEVELNAIPLTLDLSIAYDYLRYKTLISLTDKIAPNAESEFYKKSYIYVIESREDMNKVVKIKGDKTKRAWKLAGKMDGDKTAMIDYLSCVGATPSSNSETDWLEAQISLQVENNIKEFLEVLEAPTYESRVLLTKAIKAKAVKKTGHSYSLSDGTKLCEAGEVATLATALDFLTDKDNQEIVMLIEGKLKI